MGADTVKILGAIAIKTEGLETAILREPIFSQPLVEVTTSANLTAVIIAIVVHMVDGQNVRIGLSTTDTYTSISCEGFLTKIRIPDRHVSFFNRPTTNVFKPVAIRAEQLKPFLGKAVLTEPQIKTVTITSGTAMFSTIIMNVVYRKKCGMRLATDGTFATIGCKDLITQLISIACSISIAIVTNTMTRFSRTSKAFAAHATLPFLNGTLVSMSIHTIEQLPSFIRSFSVVSFMLLLKGFLAMCKILIVATRLACRTQAVFRIALLVEATSRKPLLTSRAEFYIGIILLLFVALITKVINYSRTDVASDTGMRMICNILVTFAGFAGATQTICSIPSTMPVLSSSRKPLFTLVAILLLLRRYWIDVKGGLINSLISQCVKIESVLSKVLRYNRVHGKTPILVITPVVVCSYARVKHYYLNNVLPISFDVIKNRTNVLHA